MQLVIMDTKEDLNEWIKTYFQTRYAEATILWSIDFLSNGFKLTRYS